MVVFALYLFIYYSFIKEKYYIWAFLYYGNENYFIYFCALW